MTQDDLKNADVHTLRRMRDSGDRHQMEAVRIEIERRLKLPPPPTPGAFVIADSAGAK